MSYDDNIHKLIPMPEPLKKSFIDMAKGLLWDMDNNKLVVEDVKKCPAPEPKFIGHYVRKSIQQNCFWWRELYKNHPRKLDRKCFIKALERIKSGVLFPKIRQTTFTRPEYHILAFETIQTFLLDGLEDEPPCQHAINYYVHEVPF